MSSRLVIRSFTVSADGFGAGPDQSLEAPLGVGGEDLHGWLVATPTFQGLHLRPGEAGPADGIDERYAALGFARIGAWVMGRNMFGPVRGPWPDASWRGWWGEDPPYHVPVFVLTRFPRPPLEMDGGTTFHFVTDGLEAALARARDAAGDLDVRLGGGVSTLRQAFAGRHVDEAHIAVSPVLLGRGESLFGGLDLPALGYRVTGAEPGEAALHLTVTRGA